MPVPATVTSPVTLRKRRRQVADRVKAAPFDPPGDELVRTGITVSLIERSAREATKLDGTARS